VEREFRTICGYYGRDFQIRVARAVLTGKPVVLRVPTGYGKTAAAEFPFLYAWQRNDDFPRQMIYNLPLRVLANSLHKKTFEMADKCGIKSSNVRLQTGEFPDDAAFLGDITFTTYDQLLSGFLHIPLSQSSRMANLLAGAAVSSYLVFDEVHLMEMGRALSTTVAMLKWLKGVAPSLLMSATLTNDVMQWIQSELDAEVIELNHSELQAVPNARTWHRENRLLDVQHILKCHRDKRTIIVANTVDSAQSIYQQLEDHRSQLSSRTKIVLLHARFFRRHRKIKEQQLLKLFDKDAQRSAILVATQVIEVGLDISCDNLHTELAPANSLIQRAGRCARFAGEIGDVWVYDAQGTLPYSDDTVKATRSSDQALWLSNNSVGYKEELDFVEDVHGAADKSEIAKVQGRRQQMLVAIETRDLASYQELVRKIDSVFVIITPQPEKLRLLWDVESLSLHPGTLRKQIQEKDAGHNLVDEDLTRWFAKKPVRELPEEDEKKAQRQKPPRWDWPVITRDKDCEGAFIIALNPKFVSYSFKRGLRFEPNDMGREIKSPIVVRRERERYSYQRETYLEHIQFVWKACCRHFVYNYRLDYAARRIEANCGLNQGDFYRLLRYVIAFHDVGKLSQEWVKATKGYQRERWGEDSSDFLGHTQYNPDVKRDTEVEHRFSRPPHASEGAMLMMEVLRKQGFPDTVCYAFFSAVAAHHSPFIKSVSGQTLSDGAVEAIRDGARACGINAFDPSHIALQCKKHDRLDTDDRLLKPSDDTNAFLLLLLLVRVLRISDQFSFEEA